MRTSLCVLLVAYGVLVETEAVDVTYPIRATAVILRPLDQQNSQPMTLGTVLFEQQAPGAVINVSGSLNSLSPGAHGFHVHQLGTVSPNCVASKAHFNPYNKTHGDITSNDRHIGDLANVQADQSGIASFQFQVPAANLPLIGKDSIVGRTIVVHKDADDLGKGGQSDSLTTGHAGDRIGCGVIGYGSDFVVAGSMGIMSTASLTTVLTAAVVLRTLLRIRD